MEFGDDGDELQKSPGNSPQSGLESMSLAERLSKKVKKVKAEPGTKAKATKGKKQATLPFKPVKKESPHMDSFSDSEPEVVAPRVAQPRRAADKLPSIMEAFSNSDDDEPKPKKTAKPRKRKNSDSDSGSDFGVKQQTKPSKKSKAVDDDDFIANFSDSENDASIAPSRSRTARAKKPITYIEDSDNDDMF